MRDSAAVIRSSSRADKRTGKETSRPKQSDGTAFRKNDPSSIAVLHRLQVANENHTGICEIVEYLNYAKFGNQVGQPCIVLVKEAKICERTIQIRLISICTRKTYSTGSFRSGIPTPH
jgi:hypothetical protein